RQLGGHADHIHRVFALGHHSTPRCFRGDFFSVSASSVTSSFCFLFNLSGTTTCTVASRSLADPSDFLMPRPRNRNVLPDEVPAGIFNVTGPFSVGTFTSEPSAASVNVTGRFRVTSDPLRPKNLCGWTLTRTYRSPASPPADRRSPPARARMRAP